MPCKIPSAMLLYRKISFFSGFRPPEVSECAQTFSNWGFRCIEFRQCAALHGQDGAGRPDIRQGQMFNINLVDHEFSNFSRLWLTESAIVVLTGREFHVSRETRKDVREFIDALKNNGLQIRERMAANTEAGARSWSLSHNPIDPTGSSSSARIGM